MPKYTEAEIEEMLRYMAPGSTIEDIVSSSDEDYDDDEAGDFHVVDGNGAQSAPTVVAGNSAVAHANTQKGATSLAKFQPAQHKNANAKVLKRIHVDDYYAGGGGGGGGTGGAKANERVLGELRDMTMKQRFNAHQESKKVDRSERATVENVMDPRTRLILYKLVNSGILREINGCVSTGKEANVYYAVSGDGSDAALKVYKTSILVFKDRDQYVNGEFRFQRYCKSNPRKMVRTWAEKEARNLTRLQEGGVLAPAVKLLRQHVLVMEFLGEDGWPAPRLKEVKFPSFAALDQCYLDLCCTMRKMYARCRLIHGDLSEYNLLLYRGRVVVIDVSQSVENDHPRSMDFLRRDIVNVNAFFRTQGHPNLFSLQELFHFITAPPAAKGWQRSQGPDNTEELMQHVKDMRATNEKEGRAPIDADQAKVDEQVFLQINVPRSLNEISEHRGPNREQRQFVADMLADEPSASSSDDEEEKGEEEEGPEKTRDNESGDGDDDEEGDLDEEEDDAGAHRVSHKPISLSEMSKDERKEHKKNVKEAKRTRREEKKLDGTSKKGKRKHKK